MRNKKILRRKVLGERWSFWSDIALRLPKKSASFASGITHYDKQEILSCRLGSRRLRRRCSLIDKQLARPITLITLNESNLGGFQRCGFLARVKLPAVDSSRLRASNKKKEVMRQSLPVFEILKAMFNEFKDQESVFMISPVNTQKFAEHVERQVLAKNRYDLQCLKPHEHRKNRYLAPLREDVNPTTSSGLSSIKNQGATDL